MIIDLAVKWLKDNNKVLEKRVRKVNKRIRTIIKIDTNQINANLMQSTTAKVRK